MFLSLPRVIRSIFSIEDLRKKLLYTFAVLAVFRFGKHIPLPGIDVGGLVDLSNSFSSSGFLSYLDFISGGALSQGAIFALGIMPYITSSIMMQFIVLSFPSLEALSKEGESGRAVINQYTRYLALGVSFFQSGAILAFLERGFGSSLVLEPSWAFRIKSTLLLAAGAMFVMWLGEQITAHGVGQGASLLIFANIVVGVPEGALKLANSVFREGFPMFSAALVLLFILFMIVCIVFLERAERRVPVHYARRMVGRKSVGGVSSYIPFKINSAGVMPVILTMPAMLMITGGLRYLFMWLLPDQLWLISMFDHHTVLNSLLTGALIIWFTFAYTSITFNPHDLADNLRKSSGFVPGIRPGAKTAEFFDYVLTRIGTPGAIYIALLAIIPGWILYGFSSPIGFSGLSLLIAVGVALDTSSQIEGYLIESRYDGFMEKSSTRFQRVPRI